MLQVSIVRSEGVKEGAVGEFLVEGNSVKPLPAYTEPTFLLPKGKVVRILMKLRKEVICSGTYSVEVFPVDGFQWLPLTKLQADLFNKLPEEVGLPRVLVFIASSLSPVFELSEAESEESESEPCIILKRCNDRCIKSVSLDMNQDKLENLVSEFKNLYQNCSKELEHTKKMLVNKNEEVNIVKKQYEVLRAELEETRLNAKLREEFLEGLLNDREKEHKKAYLSERVESNCLQNFCAENIDKPKNFTGKFNRSGKENFRKSDGKKSGFSETIGSINNQKITQKALELFLKKSNKVGKFIKDSGNIYKYGKKKVFVTVKNGNLLCRVGGGFENIERFIEKNAELPDCESPKHALHRRARTVSTLRSKSEPKDNKTSLLLSRHQL